MSLVSDCWQGRAHRESRQGPCVQAAEGVSPGSRKKSPEASAKQGLTKTDRN